MTEKTIDMVPPRNALAYRSFRLLWISSLCSWFSQWTQQATLGWVVYEVTGSGALLGAVLGIRAIPMMLLTPLSGLAADRWDRRKLLWSSQLLACAVSLTFTAILALGNVSNWLLFVFTVLMGASNVMDRPARMTAAFELVPREMRMKAVALNTTSFSLMRIVGPALAGYIIAAVGAAGCFLLQSLLYLASACVILQTAMPDKAADPGHGSARSSLLEGFHFAFSDRQLRMLLLLGALPFLLTVPVWGTLLPIFAKDTFSAGPRELGWLLTAVGVGGTLGGMVAHRVAWVQRQALLQVLWISVMCMAIFGLAMSPSLPLAIVCVAFAGAAEMAHYASNAASLQMSAPAAMRGRISSLLMLNPTLISVGAFLAGPLAQALGVRMASMTLAGVALALVMAMLATSASIRSFKVAPAGAD